ncbi:MAG: hypothetical protein EBZ58_09765 [Bacteroidetes bacterium]|nr:hypothetical protein [Bacteroidota bacterium]
MVWKKLEKAATNRHEGWHLASVGTIRDHCPELRTMVLRGADRNKNAIWFHTDLRSPKLTDISTNPSAAILLYDPKSKWQLRLKGSFHFDSDSNLTEAAWKKTSPSAKRCYQGPSAPSSVASGPSSNIPDDKVSPDAGRNHFTRLIFLIHQLEWLALDSDGHRRASWRLVEGSQEGTWLNP